MEWVRVGGLFFWGLFLGGLLLAAACGRAPGSVDALAATGASATGGWPANTFSVRGCDTGFSVAVGGPTESSADPGTPNGVEPIDRGGYFLLPPALRGDGEALLIWVPGAQVAATAYFELARAIQGRTPFPLWVAMLSFPANLTNPIQLGAKLDRIEAEVLAAEGAGGIGGRVVLAGHSLGGIFSRSHARQRGYGGLILLGSYLANGWFSGAGEGDEHMPVLTLGAELDGLTRLTRVALAYAEHVETSRADSEYAAMTLRPVIVIPGAVHMFFADGSHLDGDLEPETTRTQAHEDMAVSIGAFLTAHLATQPSLVTQGARQLACMVNVSKPYLEPFLNAMQREGELCRRSQTVAIAGGSQYDGSNIVVSQTDHSNDLSFLLSQPSIRSLDAARNGAQMEVIVHRRAAHDPNPMDVATVSISARQVACKMKSSESVAAAAGEAIGTPPDPACRDLNEAAFQWALANAPEATRQRFTESGWRVQFGEDHPHTTGFSWVGDNLSFEAHGARRTLDIASPVLDTATEVAGPFSGMHYCKLLSPARALEWLMVDSLR